ncbi:MAG: WD40 repeat domain-containing serine/threonine protein kinase [Ktedonobacteraceae bacterium]
MVDRIGRQLGNYRFLQLLGEGGFAEVYLGEHIHLGTQAAIKLLTTQLTSEDVIKFRNEARTLARLVHPHIVRILDFGIEDRTPFLVMDYAMNGTLRHRHPIGTIVPLSTVASYVRQTADALQYAHDKKIIHRDIKPENMLIGWHHEVLLTDFGIAVVVHSSRYQRPQDLAGTIMYMAPEQIQAHPRPASDQYALAITVYEWLCGERPFQGSFNEIAIKQNVAAPPSLRERVAAIPVGVERVIFKALAKEPNERFPTIRTFAEAFEQASQESGDPRLGRPTSLVGRTWSAAPFSHERNDPSYSAFQNIQPPVAPYFISPAAQTFQPSTSFVYNQTELKSLQAGQEIATFLGHHSVVRGLAWSHDSTKLVTTSDDGRVSVWNLAYGRSIWEQRAHRKAGLAVAWSPHSRYIVSAGKDKSIKVIEFGIFKETVCQEHDANVTALAWAPDSAHFASASDDKRICIWSAHTWRPVRLYRQHSDWVATVAWSPDGTYLVSAGYGTDVRVWQASSGRTVYVYRAHAGNVYIAQWSPDGQYIASAGNGGIVRVWQALSGTKVCWYSGHTERVNTLSWSPDGSRIASGCVDGSVHVWHVATSRVMYAYTGHTRSITAVTWSPDGQYIASAGEDGCVYVWAAP